MADGLVRYRPSFPERIREAIRGYLLGPMLSSDPNIAGFFGASSATSTGLQVTETNALTYSAVWAAVSLISSQIGNLPLMFYRKLPNRGKEIWDRNPLYRLVHDRPNPVTSAFVFRETLQAHVMLWGNAYAEIQRNGAGQAAALWPITPDRVTPFLNDENSLRYRIVNSGKADSYVDSADMLHIPGHGFNGICGYSLVQKMRESIGVGLAAEKFGATFFGNGATFGGVISTPHPRPTNEQAIKNDREAINARHQGVDRAHKLLLLYGGATYARMGVSPNEAQFLETRVFQVNEVARWFNIPPHKLKELTRATYDTIEHQNLEYLIDCLAPWLKRWEQELCEKLIPSSERNLQTIEFVVDDLLRGDVASRGDFYSKQFNVGAVTPNEIRVSENRNPIDGGDDAYVPLNEIPMSLAKPYYESLIDSNKAKAEQARRPPPEQNAPNPAQAREIDTLQTEIATVRRALQEALDAKERIIAEDTSERSDLVGRLAAAEAVIQELRAVVAQRSIDLEARTAERDAAIQATADAVTLKDRLVADAATAQTELTARCAALTARVETEQRERADERTAAESVRVALTNERDEARATTERYGLAKDAAQSKLADLAGELATRIMERDALATQRADETTAYTQRLESLSLNEQSAQREREDALRQWQEREADLVRMTNRAESLGHDLIAAQKDLSSATELVTLLEREREDLTTVHQALTTRAEAAEATIQELRTQVVKLTTDSATLTAALSDAREQFGRMQEAKAEADRKREAADGLTTMHETAATQLRERALATKQAIRNVLVYDLGCLMAREADRARKSAGTPEKFGKWLESFYGLHEDVCRTALRPAVHAWLVASGTDLSADRLLDRIIPMHIGESTRQLKGLLEHNAETLAPALERVLRRWEQDRAESFADRMLNEAA